MTDAETIAELRALLAERDARIEALKKTVDRLMWDNYRSGKPPDRTPS